MGEQFNKHGERVRRKIYTGGWVTGGYPVEAGAKQLGIFDSRRPRTVNVKGYTVKPHPRRWPKEASGAMDAAGDVFGGGGSSAAASVFGGAEAAEGPAKETFTSAADSTTTELVGVAPKASYSWIPWTVGILALAYWLSRP
tara:strand:+ start:142 stop:564 length:423 start_codon:yes stop_codon:yes gene_type:complete